MSSSKRDKFAALTEKHKLHQQQLQQQQQQEQQRKSTNDESPLLSPSPTKSTTTAKNEPGTMAAERNVNSDCRSEKILNSTTTLNTSGSSLPTAKRDKFSALTARNAYMPSSSSILDTSDRTGSDVLPSSSSSLFSLPPQPDKMVALESRRAIAPSTSTECPESIAPSNPRRDKLSTLAGSTVSASSDTASVEPHLLGDKEKERIEAYKTDLQRKKSQRDHVWNDLDRAEYLVTHLLGIASDTCQQLADVTFDSSMTLSSSLLELSSQYLSTVQEIHRLLKPCAHLVQAYPAASSFNHLYIAKFRSRLARERRNVLAQHVELLRGQQQQQQQNQQHQHDIAMSETLSLTAGSKRKQRDADSSVGTEDCRDHMHY